jgi:hypothetical protein
MQYHYGPTGAPTTRYGAPMNGLGENYSYGPMRITPIPTAGVGSLTSSVTSSMNSAVKTALEFGAGFVIGQMMAPSAKDKTMYGVGAGLATVMFGVVGLGVGALVLQQTQK